MKNMFSIGEVSKCQNISKQTLIFYDKIGLFQPAYVDPNNGYRYYSANQIDYLDTILIMNICSITILVVAWLLLENKLMPLIRGFRNFV